MIAPWACMFLKTLLFLFSLKVNVVFKMRENVKKCIETVSTGNLIFELSSFFRFVMVSWCQTEKRLTRWESLSGKKSDIITKNQKEESLMKTVNCSYYLKIFLHKFLLPKSPLLYGINFFLQFFYIQDPFIKKSHAIEPVIPKLVWPATTMISVLNYRNLPPSSSLKLVLKIWNFWWKLNIICRQPLNHLHHS